MHRLTAEALERLSRVDWKRVDEEVTETGAARVPDLLKADECTAIAGLYDQPALFRSRVVMARHGFGKGEYQYFASPLPPWLSSLRRELYGRLALIANAWGARLSYATAYPATHQEYLKRCHAAKQQRPTPLLLRYVAGDYNCLHQDLYGDEWFPLQVIVLLDEPGRDFGGGELVLVEQRPRMQSRPMVVPLKQGDGAVIAVNHRPRRGSRGDHRVTLRHGVSLVTAGRRHTLGIIFHDAK